MRAELISIEAERQARLFPQRLMFAEQILCSQIATDVDESVNWIWLFRFRRNQSLLQKVLKDSCALFYQLEWMRTCQFRRWQHVSWKRWGRFCSPTMDGISVEWYEYLPAESVWCSGGCHFQNNSKVLVPPLHQIVGGGPCCPTLGLSQVSCASQVKCISEKKKQ